MPATFRRSFSSTPEGKGGGVTMSEGVESPGNVVAALVEKSGEGAGVDTGKRETHSGKGEWVGNRKDRLVGTT